MDYADWMIKNILPQINMVRRTFLLGGASLCLIPGASQAATPTIAHITSARVLGSNNASIRVTEFFSMTCSHCASFHNDTFPDVKKRLIDTGMVRFEMRPFPFDWIGLRAHAVARALPENQYFHMVSLFLKDIDRWARSADPLEALSQMARMAGMNSAKFDAAMSEPFLEAIVGMQQTAHKTWKIESTPSFLINDKTILSGNMSYEDFSFKINATDT